MSELVAYWLKKRQEYLNADWSNQPTLFAKKAVNYFPDKGRILDLGAGLGQDSRWFATLGYQVVAADIIDPTDMPPGVGIETVDMSKPLPFTSESFDVVYAHLSLHYFSRQRTEKLFDEIHTCLKPGGILAFLVNTVGDPEAQEGEEIEENLRRIKGIAKRFYTLEFAKAMTQKFETIVLDDNNDSHKDMRKGVNSLIGYIGRKPA